MLRKVIPMIIFSLIFVTLVHNPIAEASKRDEVLKIADQYNNKVPYRYGGTTPSGFDCSGFVGYVMNQANLSVPRTAADMYNVGTPVAKSDLVKGDLVFFRTSGNQRITHVGFYAGNNRFIHASTSKGVIYSSINDPYYWGSRYAGARRVIQEEKVEAVVQQPPARVLSEGEFHDVPTDHWAYNEIKDLSLSSLIAGIGNDKFGPNDKLTRAQLAALVARITDLPLDSGLNGFRDVPSDHWAAKAIAATDHAGYFSYINGDTFYADQPVTREEVAFLFTKAFDLSVKEAETAFADVDPTNWAYEEIQALRSSGIVKGFEDGTYRPTNNITRAEFSKMLHTALN